MAGGRDNRFTIFDAMEKAGAFDSNPANTYSRSPTDGSSLYTGPIEYPKMLYHPLGEEKITVPAELLQTPMGPKAVGEQRELIWKIVNSKAEHDEAIAEGWWDHPAKAIRARVEKLIDESNLSDAETKALLKTIPVMSSDSRIKDLEAEIERLTNARADEQAARAADQKVAVSSKTPPPKPALANPLSAT